MAGHYSLWLGWRHALGRKGPALSVFLARTSMAGLALGVGLLICVLAVMSGFDRELRQRILGLVPHVSLIAGHDGADWQQAQAALSLHPEVAHATPVLQLSGMLVRGSEAAPGLLYGLDPEVEKQVAAWVEVGGLPALTALGRDPESVVLGSALAERLKLAAGDRVTVLVPGDGPARSAEVARLTVAALLHTGTELDQRLALVNLAQARALAPGRGVGLRLLLHDLFAAPRLVSELNLQWQGEGFYSSDWTRHQGNLYSAIQLSRRLVGMMVAIVIAVAVFNVVAALVLVVNDKQGEIAILRSQGATSGDILLSFVTFGLLVGALGTGLGVALGVALALGIGDLVQWAERLLGVHFLRSDIYPVSFVPSDLRWLDVGRVAATALLLSALAAVYPAWRAARLLPAEVLRYD